MTASETLFRYFKVGANELPDPAPHLPAHEAVQLLARTYPYIAQSTLEGPEVVGDRLLYTVLRPPSQTNGSKRADSGQRQAVEKALEAWGRAESTAAYDEALHDAVATLLLRLKLAKPGALDPFIVPMA